METFVNYLITIFPPLLVFAVLILLVPEKVEKWVAMFWYFLSRLGTLFDFAHKRAVKLDIQGGLNDYVKKISKEIPQISKFKVEVELVDEPLSKKNFLEDDKVILRLRRNDPYETNFVHGAYLFVSTSLLHQAKRYISQSQREALDLYVTTRVLEKEKPSIVGQFLDEYLHPELHDSKSKKTKYYDKFAHIDTSGLFYPVLLEELEFLGAKVFGDRKDEKIITEVDGLVEFLEAISERKVGDDGTDLNHKREYCRFAIMIIGKKFKLTESMEPYIKFIREKFHVDGIETIYVLGRVENKEYVEKICEGVADIYWQYKNRNTKTVLRFNDGTTEMVVQNIVALRLVGASVFQPS